MADTPAPPSKPIEQAGADSLDYLIVRVGGELFALAGPCVREIARWHAPVPVPGAPAVIPGIIGQRGVVLPVVDLRLVLGLPATPPARSTRLVIAQHEATDLALLVDEVLDLARLSGAALALPPAALDPGRARLLAAVARHGDLPLGVINLAALIIAVQEGL
ncbi:MAG: chemotaxis protein CheW [Chloroflexales bacterium]|nr:chemotaxis protein CheW [Chloroflexales bacterium]